MCWKKGSWQPVLWTLWGLYKLSTHGLLCTGQNPGQMSLFQRMWGTKTWFCFSYRGNLTTRTEYQGWNLPAIITISKMNVGFFKHNSNTRHSEADSSSPALAFLKSRGYEFLFHRTDQPALSKAPFCSGSVWLSSVAQGGLAQAYLHKHQFLQEIHAQQCTWRNASSIKNQLLKRNPYYLNMGARLVNLKAHMKPISCNFVAIYNWGVCVCVYNWFQMQVTMDWLKLLALCQSSVFHHCLNNSFLFRGNW